MFYDLHNRRACLFRIYILFIVIIRFLSIFATEKLTQNRYMIMRFLFLALFIATSLTANSQTISGKLVEENGQPLSYANVVLLSLPDSAFVCGTISEEDGAFILEATSGMHNCWGK